MVSKHLVDNYLRKTVMNAKLSNLSELTNILSVKSFFFQRVSSLTQCLSSDNRKVGNFST